MQGAKVRVIVLLESDPNDSEHSRDDDRSHERIARGNVGRNEILTLLPSYPVSEVRARLR